MRFIDFEELKRQVSCIDLVERLGWRASARGARSYRGSCPIHKSSSPNSRSFSVCHSGFQCFKCRAKGDVITLYALLEGMPVPGDTQRAAARLCEFMLIPVPFVKGSGN